jgi:hypothetical protein
MWKFRQFKTKVAYNNFLKRNEGKIQFVEVFVNNAYALEYRKLRRIY